MSSFVSSHSLVLFVNGTKIIDDAVDPSITLLTYIREKLRLPGTKMGCAEGGCGACTVMVSRMDRSNNTIMHFSVNACLAPVVTLHGMAVTTVEGIGSTKTKLHPVQERIARSHGSQCGFCTPGMVMSMYTLLRNSPTPTMAEIEEYFTGNLCRCTGYRPILEGYRTFTSPSGNGCGKEKCCQIKSNTDKLQNGDQNSHEQPNSHITPVLFKPEQFTSYDPSQDIIFPPELKMMHELDEQDLEFKSDRVAYYRPTSIDKLLLLKKKFPHAKLIVGNTEVGVEVKFKNQLYPVLICPSSVKELSMISDEEDGLLLGASATLTKIDDVMKDLIKQLPEYKTRVLQAIVETFKWFAGKQIRNVAAIGGNIMTGSPISDLNPVLMAAGAVLTLRSIDGERKVKLDGHFYTGYRRNIALPQEILVSIYIPYTRQNEYLTAYKQARRREDDIAIVNCGFLVQMKPGTAVVDLAVLAFGGVAPTTVLANNTMKLMQGRTWNKELLQEVSDTLLADIPLPPSAPGGMINYRRALTLSFFFKFYLLVKGHLSEDIPGSVEPLSPAEQNITRPYKRPAVSSTQLFQRTHDGQEPLDPIGRPVPHNSSDQQATGEATYVDDIPRYINELSAAFVLTSKATGRVAAVDYKPALAVPGVHSVVTSEDIPASRNRCGLVKTEEKIFVSSKIECVGQVIAVVLADDHDTATRAAKLVNVTYADVKTPILSIQDAIKENSFHAELKLKKGDPETAFKSCQNILEGEIHIGGQEHFYMETNCHIAIPQETDEMEIISSTQSPTVTQNLVASALGVGAHKIVCRTKRLGGGFGGKETRTVMVSVPIAVAARKVGRPVRIVLDRDVDMQMTGTRHPYHGKWKVGFDQQGTICSVQVEIYSNAGFSTDLSIGVLERSLLSIDNGCSIEHFSVIGKACKTNLPSNTAFRGFGGPQGMLVMEDIIQNVAEYLQMHPNLIREKNMYKTGDITPYQQTLERCTLRQCWDQVLVQSNNSQLQEEIKKFNKENRYMKRGIAAIPVKYGINFTVPKLNQGSALLLVYTDGTVLISHGGTEMGQGLHIKMIQIAAHTLQIRSNKIFIAETATDKVPNASPTAASASTDIYGDAVLKACKEINERLSPIKNSLPDATWEQVVMKAYEERISLSAVGFHKTANCIPINWTTGKGSPFNYFSYGAAVSVVEINCLTGDHSTLQTDIVMDVGTSLNPAIDIGQIEGAFAQGLGLFTLEELYYTPEGLLLTKGPGAYKMPGFTDIPCKFNVSLLRDAPNPRAVYSSKAIGEPPLFLAASVFFAIKDAIKSARENEGLQGEFRLDSPATAERIRMACEDSITKKLQTPAPGSFKPWAVIV